VWAWGCRHRDVTSHGEQRGEATLPHVDEALRSSPGCGAANRSAMPIVLSGTKLPCCPGLYNPRIPIWVGASIQTRPLPRRGDKRACINKTCISRSRRMLGLPAFIDKERAGSRCLTCAYDIIERQPTPRRLGRRRDYIRSSRAGMTWWVEYVPRRTGLMRCVGTSR
jgi:hypothetical protein